MLGWWKCSANYRRDKIVASLLLQCNIHTLRYKMKHLLLFLMVILVEISQSNAQSPKWIRGGATNQDFSSYNFKEEALFMCTDQNRNVYTLSIVGGSALTADTFSRPTGAYGSPKNVLLTSHNCNGQMRFAKLITSNATIPYGVVADNSGHVYLAVDAPHYATSSATTFRIGYDTTITSHTNNRVTLVQLDTNGHLNWLRYVGENSSVTFSGTGGPYNHLALDALGNPHLVAPTSYGVNLTPSFISHMGFYDLGYDVAGNLLSINKLQIDSSLLVYGIAIDRQSNKMYAYGLRFYSMFPDSSRYPYITSLDGARNRIWIDTISNPFYPSGTFTGLDVDGLGHLYCTVASAKGFVYRGDTALNCLGIPNVTTTLMKMDTAGNPRWMTVYSSTVSSGISRAIVMPNNKIAVCGSIAGGKIVSGTDTVYAYSGEGQNVIYSIVDSAGYIQTFQQMHGAGFYDNGSVCTSDNIGNLYISGKVESNISAGSVSPYSTVGGDSDYFIFKYGVDCNCTSMPVSNYTYSGSIGLTRSFTYTGTVTGIDSVKWTFGDGTSSSSMAPVHTYTGAGTFTTCVRVYSSCGNDMRCHEITVACTTTVTSAFTDTDTLVHSFTYTGTTAGYDSVVWDFGDGVSDTGLAVIHIYTVADTYHVCATVYTNCGSHTYCRDIYLGVPDAVSETSIAAKNISVHPNPTSNELYVSGIYRDAKYRLRNVLGMVIQDGILGRANNTLYLGTLPAGIYLLEIMVTDGSTKTIRVTKQ
jgi:hypothetical protein